MDEGRTCRKCGEFKAKDGYTLSYWLKGDWICKACVILRQLERRKVVGSAANDRYRWVIKVANLRKNCIKRGIECSIEASLMRKMYSDQGGQCAISGVQFGMEAWNTASIDRIEPALGYISTNVRLILFCLNSFRGIMQDDQMYDIMLLTLKKQGHI